MKRKLIVAFSATVLVIGVAIGIAANCGSTWVASLDLSYKASKYTDQYGNKFRYRAKERQSRNSGRALDVGCFLATPLK